MVAANAKSDLHRILIFTPFGKDQVHLANVLSAQGHYCIQCTDILKLVSKINENVGIILTTEEVLTSKDSNILIEALREQPTWSAIPVIAFYSQTVTTDPFQRKMAHPLHKLTDVTFLQRPTEAATLFSAVSAALRDRQRQYQIRDLLVQLQDDIEQRKKHEIELKSANQALEKSRNEALLATQTKSQFLANMSHEIRTPLGVITGFLDLIKSSDVSSSDRYNYMNAIERNSQQLLRLVDDILDISKVEAGKLSIESMNFFLTEFLSGLSSLMTLKAEEKGIKFELKFDGLIPEVICCDQVRLRQILVNLIGNAIKFTEKGKVELLVSFDGEFLQFFVSDTGIGINSDKALDLFQPFHQADSSMTRRFGGTGLGLALSKKLSQALGGDLKLQKSEPGKGSTFLATVKIDPIPNVKMIDAKNVISNANNEARGLSDETGLLSGLKILLVEDSPDNRILISTYLNKTGAHISIAEDGVQGVERAMNEAVDVILMDVQMPRMDGHQAMRQLRGSGFTHPIIALTAHAMKEERDRCFESGCTDYLTKPIRREQLIGVLSQYLPKH